MKKHLLLAATALMALSSAFAQDASNVRYREGAAISSIDELTSGKYFLKAHCNDNGGKLMGRGEYLLFDPSSGITGFSSNFYLPQGSTDNIALIWDIETITENLPDAATGNMVFTIKNFGTNSYMVLNGTDASANRNNVPLLAEPTTAQPIAQFQLVDMPESYTPQNYYGNYKDNIRFFIQLTNGSYGPDNYPYLHTNPGKLSYWEYCITEGTAVQFEFVKAEEINSVQVTFTLPSINGVTIETQTIYASLGETPEHAIETAAAALGKGAFTVTGLTSSTGNTTVTTEGQNFTVEGVWEREMKPNHVYRLCVNPGDALHGAMRYMISTGEIETKRENRATLSRLVPERLWYFVPGETPGTFTLHTLYDTESAIYFTDGANARRAALSKDDATILTLVGRSDGDLAFTIDNGTAVLNDFGGQGYLARWNGGGTDNAGSQIRLYPLNNYDFEVLAQFGTEEEIAAAKANPTVDNVKPLIDAYNAINLEAALKRVDYLFSDGTIGPNPGQYSDPDGSFAVAIENARAVAANPDATPEEIQAAIEAINISGVNADDLTFNEMKPGFYRFRGVQNNKRYLSSISGGLTANSRRAMAMTDDNTRSNTVFYAQELTDSTYTVMCFDDGLVLPNLNGTTSWMPNHPGHSDSSTEVSFAFKENQLFVIHVGEGPNGKHRHLHDGGVNGDRANAGDGDGNNGYRWYIERVNALPVTFYNVISDNPADENDGWSSIYSPVALEIPAEYHHLSAYTGTFDNADYTDMADINHVLATPILPDANGRRIIPANQPTLLFYDGELSVSENPNLFPSQMDERQHITYVNLPIAYDVETPANAEVKGNLHASFVAVEPTNGKEYYTLHASHSNNFREYEYGAWVQSAINYNNFIPGFKAYIENAHDGIDYYPIYTINPNTMVPQFDADGDNTGLSVEKNQDTGEFTLTITTPSADFTVYYKHTPDAAPQAIRRQAQEDKLAHEFTDIADKNGKVHTITVPTAGTVEYYAYHADSKTKGATREIPVNDETATGIKSITVDAANAAVCYDLQGRRIAAPAKGISIVNGNKVLVK